jgi:hypothetical protein
MSPKLFRDVEFVGDSCAWPKEEEEFCPKEVFCPKALVWPKDEDGFCPNEDEGLLEPVAVDGRPNGMGVETKVSSSSNAASRQYDRRTSSNSTHSGSLSGNHQSPSRTDRSCDVSRKTKMGGCCGGRQRCGWLGTSVVRSDSVANASREIAASD